MRKQISISFLMLGIVVSSMLFSIGCSDDSNVQAPEPFSCWLTSPDRIVMSDGWNVQYFLDTPIRFTLNTQGPLPADPVTVWTWGAGLPPDTVHGFDVTRIFHTEDYQPLNIADLRVILYDGTTWQEWDKIQSTLILIPYRPDITLSHDSLFTEPGHELSFNAEVAGWMVAGRAPKYTWDPGDGSAPIVMQDSYHGVSTPYTYTQPGTYLATLTVEGNVLDTRQVLGKDTVVVVVGEYTHPAMAHEITISLNRIQAEYHVVANRNGLPDSVADKTIPGIDFRIQNPVLEKRWDRLPWHTPRRCEFDLASDADPNVLIKGYITLSNDGRQIDELSVHARSQSTTDGEMYEYTLLLHDIPLDTQTYPGLEPHAQYTHFEVRGADIVNHIGELRHTLADYDGNNDLQTRTYVSMNADEKSEIHISFQGKY